MVRYFPDKQAYEEYHVAFNFYRLLRKTNDSISTVAVKAYDAAGLDKTDVLTDVLTQVIESPRVYVWVKGGTPQRYKISCQIETAGGKKWEMDGYQNVVEDQT